ncbi:MAG: hypothetical protein AAF410_05510, partial [Pseudomonadota bacterium]
LPDTLSIDIFKEGEDRIPCAADFGQKNCGEQYFTMYVVLIKTRNHQSEFIHWLNNDNEIVILISLRFSQL